MKIVPSHSELLERYLASRDQAAFAELAGAHLGLIYSAALRITRSPDLAEEIFLTGANEQELHRRRWRAGGPLGFEQAHRLDKHVLAFSFAYRAEIEHDHCVGWQALFGTQAFLGVCGREALDRGHVEPAGQDAEMSGVEPLKDLA